MKKMAVVKIILSIVYLALIVVMAISLFGSYSSDNVLHTEQDMNRLLATIIITAVLIVFALSLLVFVIVRYKKKVDEERKENLGEMEAHIQSNN